MSIFNHAFDSMIVRFGYTARQLARATRVSEQTVSEFRNNRKQITTKTLEQLIFNDFVSDEARIYFFAQVLGNSVSLSSLVKGMDSDQKSEILMAIASTMLSASPKTSDSEVQRVVANSV